ncbi:MAG: ABC transporter ATP-binding protein [Nitrospirae bacterium]|nr:ABC transporter ATP-binding protein [Nitrospirota bacterium]
MLNIDNLTVKYGKISALNGVKLNVYEGEIIALIGANGAGKTSMLKAVSGMIPYGGNIEFQGKTLKNKAVHQIVSLGITHVPEGRRIFGNLTVNENLTIAAWGRKDNSGIKEDRSRVFKLFPRLMERIDQQSSTLSGGEQQMLAVGRAILTGGKLILLDEPSMGLSPIFVKEIFKVIKEINNDGATIILVEQNANMALQIANRGYVLETGSIKLSGSTEDLLNNPLVKEAYLGV